MLCLRISEQEIEIALGNTKVAFCNSTAVADEPADLEQCVKALKIAVDMLAKIKKDGKRALNKDQNLNLKKAVEEAYMELTQLQVYFGPDKVQKCFQVAGKWRNGVPIPGPIQPPPQQTPVHESRSSVDSASLSSGGTHSIPDQFYQADVGSSSGDIDIHGEENPAGISPGSSRVDLDVSGIDEPNEEQGRPREQYVKHTGCFADAAPRTEHSTEDIDDGMPGTSTGVEGNRVGPVKDDILNPETSEAASAISPQETPASPTSESNNGQSEIAEARNVQVITEAQALFDYHGENEGELSFKVGDFVSVIEYVDDDWWRGVLEKKIGIFPRTYVQQQERTAGFDYPTVSVDVLPVVAGPSTGGSLPPAGQRQMAGSQDDALSQKPLPAVPLPSGESSTTAQPPVPPSVDPTMVPSSSASEVRNAPVIARAKALYDFPGEDEGDLPFKVGDIINVTDFMNDDWWRGALGREVGGFPTAYVQKLSPPASGYPPISIRTTNGKATVEPLFGGELPPPYQGQLAGSKAGSQGNAFSQQPYFDTPPVCGAVMPQSIGSPRPPKPPAP
ncbi:MAG: hypothetical protein J3Q66DRAFT_437795 [Benniella sp.]|nr:MAG: hypothetical protein J3Q66DRAFT_437795 [Benniella sp.]